MAVLGEDCLGIVSTNHSQQICRHLCSEKSQIHIPSTLQTAIEVNSQIAPFERSMHKRVSKCRNGSMESFYIENYQWKHAWDVSQIRPSSQIWMTNPKYRLRVVRPLSSTHLLLEWDFPVRDKLADIVRLSPGERDGHREHLNPNGELDERPIPVHIQRSDLTPAERLGSLMVE